MHICLQACWDLDWLYNLTLFVLLPFFSLTLEQTVFQKAVISEMQADCSHVHLI